MKNYRLHTTEGVQDCLGTQMEWKEEILKKIKKVFFLHGYEYVKTPTLEYIDVYSEQGLQKPDLYTLINRQGEVLALCNDMTASVVRLVATKDHNDILPKKYCYASETFRYPKMYQGKSHEFLQAGVELIGVDDILADVECISLASKALQACGIGQHRIHLGSSSFLNCLFEDFGIIEEMQEKIRLNIEEKNYVDLKKMLNLVVSSEKASFLMNIILKGGKISYIEELMSKLSKTKAFEELRYLKQLYLALTDRGIDNVIFDFSIYSYAKYYTGVIFSIFTEGANRSIVDGGRSNHLFERFHCSYPLIGFGMDVDLMTDICMTQNQEKTKTVRILSYAQPGFEAQAYLDNEALRAQGYSVSCSLLKSLEEAKIYAKEKGFTYLLVYGSTTKKIEVQSL